jgi:hypothetical protein
MTAAEEAFAEAEHRIEAARESGALVLDLSDLNALARLPDRIGVLTGLHVLSLGDTQIADLQPIAALTGLTELYLMGTKVTDLRPLVGMTALWRLNLAKTGITYDSLRALTPLRRLVSDPGPEQNLPEHRGLRFSDTAAAKSDPKIAELARITQTPPQPDPTPPPRRPAPLEITVTDTEIRMAGPDALPESSANDRAAMGWDALRAHRRNFGRAFHVGNYQPLPTYLDDFDTAMGTAYDPRNVIRIGVEGLRIAALSRNGAFVRNLPVGADSDLVAFAATIDLYVRRFPDWVAYRDDADPDDVSPQAVSAAADDFRTIDEVIQSTPEAEDAVRDEYRAELTAGTGENADPPAAKALTASTGEIARALAEHGSAEAERKRRNAELARKGGDMYDKTVLAPVGLALHVMRRIEAPMRSLAKQFPNRLGWIDGWYDATFPFKDPPERP